MGVLPTECLGTRPSLEDFAQLTLSRIEGGNRGAAIEASQFTAAGHAFWALRGEEKDPVTGSPTHIEYVATVLERGLVYWQIQAHTQAAAEMFARIALHLDGGAVTALIPKQAGFATVHMHTPDEAASPELAKARAAVRDALLPDMTASRHLETEYGFSYDVPMGLELLNKERVRAATSTLRALAEASGGRPSSDTCADQLLLAQNLERPQLLTMLGYGPGCLAYPLDTGHLAELGRNALAQMRASFRVSHVETAVTQLGEHPAWAMRASIAPLDAGNPLRHLAVLMLPGEHGLVEVVIQTASPADLEALMRSPILFSDGATSELIPLSVFRSQ